MLKEVTVLVETRTIARLVARQMVLLRCAASATSTQCDITNNNGEEVVEYTRFRVTFLTSVCDKLIKELANVKRENGAPLDLTNVSIRDTQRDDNTTANCYHWCGKEESAEDKATDYVEQLVEKATTSSEVEEPTTAKPRRTRKTKKQAEEVVEQPKIEDVVVAEKEAYAENVIFESFEEINLEKEDDAEGTDGEQAEKPKRETKLPAWAVEQGLSQTEYKTLCNWRSAARWGMTYPEYALALKDAKKLNMDARKYLTRIGKVHQPDLDISYITLDYIKETVKSLKETKSDDETTVLEEW